MTGEEVAGAAGDGETGVVASAATDEVATSGSVVVSGMGTEGFELTVLWLGAGEVASRREVLRSREAAEKSAMKALPCVLAASPMGLAASLSGLRVSPACLAASLNTLAASSSGADAAPRASGLSGVGGASFLENKSNKPMMKE